MITTIVINFFNEVCGFQAPFSDWGIAAQL